MPTATEAWRAKVGTSTTYLGRHYVDIGANCILVAQKLSMVAQVGRSGTPGRKLGRKRGGR